ncbi:MAG: enolase C-terminal domain-like protein [Candidatus Poribacteria bacterium]|nr:enolase C-terminal domain-like protein [Candidatus Poribacteria bacterium]
MKITNLKIRKLEIPFNISFKHASAERNATESILVVAESDNNHKSYGESCPRSYVTDEHIDSTIAFFEKHESSVRAIENLEELRLWIEGKKGDIDANPAAWCAIELALLDLLGKGQEKSIEELLSLPTLKGEFHYTAVLGASNHEIFKKQLQQYAHAGFSDFKLKISGKLEEDIEKLNLLKKLNNKETRIRLDANNLWDTSSEAIAYLEQLDTNFFAIEEPVETNQYDTLRTIAKTLHTKIILDESFLRKEQFEHIQDSPETWIINVRISKMGGILRSLDVAEEASRLNIPIIVGAQVGETSILTRAALTIANTYRNILLAQEGAFGIYLLEKDIVETPLMFGKGGVLSTHSLIAKQGLGLHCIL